MKMYGVEKCAQLKEEVAASKKKKSGFVLKEVWDKHNVEGRCMKCGRSNY